MICPQCNNDAPDNNYKCPSCGCVLHPEVQPSDFREAPQKKSSVNPNMLIGVIGVVLLAVFIYVAVFKDKSGPTRPDSTETTDVSNANQPSGDNDTGSGGFNPGFAPPPSQFGSPSESNDESGGSDSSSSSSSSSSGSNSSSSSDSHQPGEIINASNPGETISIQNYVKKGKMTIFDFYSEYCPPCRRIGPMLKELDAKRNDIVVFKIDINRPGMDGIDWKSPVARQYNLGSIPHFIIFNASGDKEAEGEEAFGIIGELLKQENIR